MSAMERIRRAFGPMITAGQARLARALATLFDEKVGLPWKTNADGDLYPDDPNHPGIGLLDNPVLFLALGRQETSGMEGIIAERDDADGGGVGVIGLRDVDPQNPPPRPFVANAPIELNGSSVLVATGGIWLQVADPITEDHELIIGPSVTIPDGRHVSPILIGPEKVYQFEEFAEDALDYDVLDVGEVQIVTLTLVNSYAAGVSTFSFRVYLDNPGSRLTIFDVILKVDGIEATRYERSFTANGGNVADSFAISTPLNAGQVLSLHVEAISTHPQSQGWVRGTIQATRIQIAQG